MAKDPEAMQTLMRGFKLIMGGVRGVPNLF